MGFGTDLMGDMEDDQLRGVQLQVEALGAADALHSITAGNAAILRDSRLGNLEVGAFGDAILLAGNPIEDPEALWQESARVAIFQHGRAI